MNVDGGKFPWFVLCHLSKLGKLPQVKIQTHERLKKNAFYYDKTELRSCVKVEVAVLGSRP